MSGTENNGFSFLKSEIPRRLKRPFKSFKFWTYLILALLVVGGLPVFIEIYNYIFKSVWDGEAFKLAVFSFFAATVGGSSLRMVLDDDNSSIRMLGILGLVACFFITLIALDNISGITGGISFLICVALMLGSVFWWWLVNGDDPIFDEQITVQAATGGEDISRPLSGSLDGFEG